MLTSGNRCLPRRLKFHMFAFKQISFYLGANAKQNVHMWSCQPIFPNSKAIFAPDRSHLVGIPRLQRRFGYMLHLKYGICSILFLFPNRGPATSPHCLAALGLMCSVLGRLYALGFGITYLQTSRFSHHAIFIGIFCLSIRNSGTRIVGKGSVTAPVCHSQLVDAASACSSTATVLKATNYMGNMGKMRKGWCVWPDRSGHRDRLWRRPLLPSCCARLPCSGPVGTVCACPTYIRAVINHGSAASRRQPHQSGIGPRSCTWMSGLLPFAPSQICHD